MSEPDPECGVNIVMCLIGSKWKPTILWRLAEGDRRFAQLRRAVDGISEKVLTEQLRDLERNGLVSRQAYDGFPLRVEYRLTGQGAELNDLLDPVAQWGDRYADALASTGADPTNRPHGSMPDLTATEIAVLERQAK